jgi:hypothetical protein
VRQTGRMSKLHEDVSQVLWSLGMVHTNEHITPDGLFCVDIAMQDNKVCSLLCCSMCHCLSDAHETSVCSRFASLFVCMPDLCALLCN